MSQPPLLSAFARAAQSRTAPTVIFQKKNKNYNNRVDSTAQHHIHIYIYNQILNITDSQHKYPYIYTAPHFKSKMFPCPNPSKRVRNFSGTNTNRSQSVPTSSHVINDLDIAYPTDGGAGLEDCYLSRNVGYGNHLCNKQYGPL